MYYYKKHIGDYRSATGHLSLLEHGVYTCLMDSYYLNEQGLPMDERQLFRLVGARTDEEKQAVLDVVNEFFIPQETVWVHSRIDFELKKYHAKAETNRKVGGLGGRPRKKPKENPNGLISEENKTHEEPTQNPNPLTQEPINQDIYIQDKPVKFVFKNELLKIGANEQLASDWLAVRKIKKSANTKTAFDGFISQLEKSNLDVNTVLKICVDNSWSGFKCSWLANVNMADYVNQQIKAEQQKPIESEWVEF